MDTRHNFSPVPRWRVKGPLGVALAAAVIAGGLVVPTAAFAAPAEEPSAQEVAPARGRDGGLQAPDIASARTIAELEGERVEVIGERTLTSSTWVLPDGTLTTGQAVAPIWVPQQGQDPTTAAGWAPVDLALTVNAEGGIEPKSHPAGLVLAGAGVPEDGRLLSMTGAPGETVGLAWTDPLPTPRLEGPRAIYAAVDPGVDLVVEATPSGYEQFFVLTEKPAAGQAPDLSLTVISEGLSAAPAADGGVEFTDTAGQVVGRSGTPLVWDAEVDGERQHPLTESRSAEGTKPQLAPQPDWGAEEQEPGEPSVTEMGTGPQIPTTPETPPFPTTASTEPAANGPGQAGSSEAAQAGASEALPLPEAATVTGPGVVELALTPAAAFLEDPETQYPVVVDPFFDWQYGFDTYVQTGITNTDLSGDPELRLGTYNGGATVARSFLNFDLASIGRKKINAAVISLWNFSSWSCQPRNWEVWATDPAGPGTRAHAQPPWWGKWATSSQTSGYSGCGEGYVNADVTSLVQAWADGGFGLVGMGLKAENESDNLAWKKFVSANGTVGLMPSLYVNWNTPPGPATNLIVIGAQSRPDGPWLNNNQNARLEATANDPDGKSDLLFQLYTASEELIFQEWAFGVDYGSRGSVGIPANLMVEGGQYKFMVHGYDGALWNTASSVWSGTWTIDTKKPAAPFVSSSVYRNDGTWNGAAGQLGEFTFKSAEADPTGWLYEWGLDEAPIPTNNFPYSPSSSAPFVPTTNGIHVLQVQAVDKAGNRSEITKYVFNVGRAGLVSPAEGAEVVRRVRLQVTGEPGLTHAKFIWRRGPDSAGFQDIPLSLLTKADGSALTSPWTPLSSLGGYAAWDAGLTLGNVPGPVQVKAIMATDSAGGGAYTDMPWVTVTVSPDAAGAATDTVGPGTVNLLTGDYSLTDTDVSAFGLSLARASSSRDPRAGLEPQTELLTVDQQKISTGTSGYWSNAATLTRETGRGHSSTVPNPTAANLDSLRIRSTGGSADSFAEFDAYGEGLWADRTYRVTGWVYVPSSTGLSPQDDRGLRLVAYAQTNGAYTATQSSRPTVTDAWQQLSVDFTIPAGSTDALIRLYNGFSASGKDVFFDDLSVRQVWSPLGPQWSMGTVDETTGVAYTHISQPETNVAALHLTGGGEIWFTGAADKWWPEPGAEGMVLSTTGDGSWTLREIDGTVSEFTRQPAAATPDSQLRTTTPPVTAGATRLQYTNVNGRLRLDRMIAPVEPGVDPAAVPGTACTSAVPAAGCRALQLTYAGDTGAPGTAATATAFGNYADRLVEVKLWSTAPGATVTDAVSVLRYAYDNTGRLREVWDPRITPALKTAYTYDDAGRVATTTDAGQLPWRFTYGTGGANSTVGSGDLIDRSSGRLLKVIRASLAPGTVNQGGPDTTSTVVYNVPLTRAAGGPHDLNATAFATWAQTNGPTDATAVFDPETVPSVTTATATAPGTSGYKNAVVHYLDASAREVNSATPAGPDAPAAGFIDTTEYDRFGNVVWSLDATNRLLALGQLPTAAADLAALNLAQAGTATRAQALSTANTYATDGIDLLRTRGPLLRLAIGNNPADVRLVHDLTVNAYDEGKPDGFAYHLLTTKTDALLVANTAPEQLLDVQVTTNGYNPIDAGTDVTANRGPTSGWKLGTPTTVTQFGQTTKQRFDARGRTAESRMIGATGTDAGTTLHVYYTAAPNTAHPDCGNKAGYAGLLCKTYPGGAITGAVAARMSTALPVTSYTAYNRYGALASSIESATGPVNGATASQTRTTTTEYDPVGRPTAVATTGAGAGVGAAVAKKVSTYDPGSGQITTVAAVNAAGTVTSTVVKVFDALGRIAKYTDAGGAWTATTYDQFGKPTTVTDSLGTTTTYTYDRTKEPRGYVTSVADSVAGTLSATYGPDGQLDTQALPGGVILKIGYDAARTATSRTYVRTSDGSTVAASNGVLNGAGQWISLTTPASNKTFTYDPLRRLSSARDTTTGISTCTTRAYTHVERGSRASMSTAASATAACVDPANPGATPVTTTSYTYDSADRLVSDTATGAAGWTYDPLGRVTNAPVVSNPGKRVSIGFHVNDLVHSQTIEGLARQTWTLDPEQRFNSWTSETWVNGAWQQPVTKVNHYDSDSDNPAWIAENTAAPDQVTRYVTGLDDNLAMATGKTGARVLQLIDLHGDVMTTLPIADGATTATWTGLKHKAADEFGNPTDLTTGAKLASTGAAPTKDHRYGWIGGKQRSTDALAGYTLMGVRLYNPTTGLFLSPDPIHGGNLTTYTYAADPVNMFDLDGKSLWGWAKKKAKSAGRWVNKHKVDIGLTALSLIPGGAILGGGIMAVRAYKLVQMARAGQKFAKASPAVARMAGRMWTGLRKPGTPRVTKNGEVSMRVGRNGNVYRGYERRVPRRGDPYHLSHLEGRNGTLHIHHN